MSHFDKQVHGDVHVLTPKKDLTGGDETKEISAYIGDVVAKGSPKIVVDLGKVSFLNSTGLGYGDGIGGAGRIDLRRARKCGGKGRLRAA